MSLLCTSKKKKEKKKDAEAYNRTTDYDHVQNFFQDDVNCSIPKLPTYKIPSTHSSHGTLLEVVKSFLPTLATEVPVKRGEIVMSIDNDGDWVLVKTQMGDEGYIPRSYCRIVHRILSQPDISKQNYYLEDQLLPYDSNQSHEYGKLNQTSPRQFMHFTQGYCNRRTHLNSLDTSSSSSETSSPSYWDNTRRFDSLRSNESFSSWSVSSHKPVCGRKCGKKCEHQKLVNNEIQYECMPQENTFEVGSEKKSILPKKKEQQCDKNCPSGYTAIKNDTDCFLSCGHPELIVIECYEKQGSTDISVIPGDFASIINDTKYEDWIYIRNESGERGFVPTQCVLKHQCEECSIERKVFIKSNCKNSGKNNSQRKAAPSGTSNYANDVINDVINQSNQNKKEEEKKNGVSKENSDTTKNSNDKTAETAEAEEHARKAEIKQTKMLSHTHPPTSVCTNFKEMNKMVVIDNFAGNHLEDLYVCIGDFVYVEKTADMNKDLIWVHSMKQNLSGYIPSRIVRATNDIEVKADI